MLSPETMSKLMIHAPDDHKGHLIKGKRATFVRRLMTADSQVRKTDIEVFCDNPSILPKVIA